MNWIVGRYSAGITGLAVLAFAISMVVGLFTPTLFASCFASIFIAIGFVPFMCSLGAVNPGEDRKAVSLAGVAFGIIYATIILLVYYAECTTVRMNPALGPEVLSIISYGRVGSLFFNYDLLGYAFMALSTFLMGYTVNPRDRGDKALQWLLWLHGLFFFSCLLAPLFPIFTGDSSDNTGMIALEFWCAYFLPICILGYRYFSRARQWDPTENSPVQ